MVQSWVKRYSSVSYIFKPRTHPLRVWRFCKMEKSRVVTRESTTGIQIPRFRMNISQIDKKLIYRNSGIFSIPSEFANISQYCDEFRDQTFFRDSGIPGLHSLVLIAFFIRFFYWMGTALFAEAQRASRKMYYDDSKCSRRVWSSGFVLMKIIMQLKHSRIYYCWINWGFRRIYRFSFPLNGD